MASIDWDNGKTRRETFKFWDLVRLVLEIWRYFLCLSVINVIVMDAESVRNEASLTCPPPPPPPPPVPGEFPTQRPWTRSFDIFFDLRPNKRVSKQSSGWWFETLSCSLWRHCNGTILHDNKCYQGSLSRSSCFRPGMGLHKLRSLWEVMI